MAYPAYVEFHRSRDITPGEGCALDEQAVEQIAAWVSMAHELGLHVSMNLHRAPGYCINAGFHEPYNLWKSEEVQEAFNFALGLLGQTIQGHVPRQDQLRSLNEPAPALQT